MKKVLLSLCTISCTMLSAQKISFEASEGFSVGDITGQSAEWVLPETKNGSPLGGQEIVDTESSDGNYSFRNGHTTNFGPQEYPIVGAFYVPEVPIKIKDNFTFTYDFKGDRSGESSDFVVQLFAANPYDTESSLIIQYFNFSHEGTFETVVAGGSEGGLQYSPLENFEWTPNVWHTMKAVNVGGTDFDIYIDGEKYGTAIMHTNAPIVKVRFVHDNYALDAYYDNVRFSVENLPVKDSVSKEETTIYPNPARAMVEIKLADGFDANKTKVILNDLTGKTVATFNNIKMVNVNKLSAGVYIMTITDGNKTETKKLIKD